ncbi:hypothetical protein L873DRAFT_1798616 [Choiromyces venosus 120613-1]|uniref:Uncharacterized protein n=1 Tax=Choiromyces venosus 120613-1 TaxID=1336337 RepID=A0A3N4K2K9_9PEZI|nr:hypothetical protein L873DRAFT_1798616 [Choiromyces venosus 120613-1]
MKNCTLPTVDSPYSAETNKKKKNNRPCQERQIQGPTSSSVNSNRDIYERVVKWTYSIGHNAQLLNHGLLLEYEFHEVEASLRNPRVDRGS